MANLDIIIRMLKSGTGGTATTAELKAMESQALATSARLSAIGGSAMRTGAMLTMATAPLAAFGLASVKAASDTTESMSKMNVTFGAASTTIDRFAETAAEDLGMSSREAIDAASSFGGLFSAMGAGQGQAAEMSMTLTQLTADLGSFYNVTSSDALAKLKSGLVGEYEPLRALNVVLNESMVAQKAVQMGLAQTTGSVSEQARVMARYQLILEQTGPAQGDFARTGGNLANSMKTASSELANASAQMGTALIPMAIAATKEVTALATAFNDLDPAAQNAVVALGGLLVIAGPLTTALGALLKVAGALPPALATIAGLASGPLAVLFGAAGGAGPSQAELVLKQAPEQYKDLATELSKAVLDVTTGQWQTGFEKLGADLSRGYPMPAGATGPGPGALTAWAEFVAAHQALLGAYTGQVRTMTNTFVAVTGGMERAPIPVVTAGPPAYRTPYTAPTAGMYEGMYWQHIRDDEKYATDLAVDRERRQQDAIALTQAAAERAAARIQERFTALASAVSSAINDARSKARSLFDLTGGGAGGIVTEPGKGGPFEKLYQILAVATAGMPGREMTPTTAAYAAEHPGMDFMAVSEAFQKGLLLVPGVFENIDWRLLGEQAAQGLESANLAQYAGQAAAQLMATGQPLTPENIRTAVQELAAKGDIGNAMQAVQNAVNIGTATLHPDLVNILGAVNGLKVPTGGNGGTTERGARTNNVTVNIQAGAVALPSSETSVLARELTDRIFGALRSAELQTGLPAPSGVAGAR